MIEKNLKHFQEQMICRCEDTSWDLFFESRFKAPLALKEYTRGQLNVVYCIAHCVYQLLNTSMYLVTQRNRLSYP